jgi:hypothetical protein
LYVAKKSKNASRLSALSDEWDNLTQVAVRMGYPRELMSDDLFGAVQTYCEARQETQLQLQRRLGAAPSPSAWPEGSPPRGTSLPGADLISPSAPPRRAKLAIGNGEAHAVRDASSVAVGQPRTEARKWPANSLVANRSQSHSARARPEAQPPAEASPTEEDAEDDESPPEEDAEYEELLPVELPAIEKRQAESPVRARAPAKAPAANRQRDLETTHVEVGHQRRALKGSSTHASQKPVADATPNVITKQAKAKSPSMSAAVDAVAAWEMPSLHIPDAASAAPTAKRRKRGEPQPMRELSPPAAAAAVAIADDDDARAADLFGDTSQEAVAAKGGISTPRDLGSGSADEAPAADGEGGDALPGSLEERLALADAQQSGADGQGPIVY